MLALPFLGIAAALIAGILINVAMEFAIAGIASSCALAGYFQRKIDIRLVRSSEYGEWLGASA